MNRNFAGNAGTGGSPFTGASPVPASPINTETDPLLADREVAAMIGIGRSTVWRWVADGILRPPLKLGGISRWKESWINEAIDKAEQAAE